MTKTEVRNSLMWALRMLGLSCLGFLWILLPSITIFTVGVSFAPIMGWKIETVKLAATNAFIIWMSVQGFFILFDRYMDSKIRYGIEAYHNEFIDLKKRWAHKQGTSTEHETIKTLKEKLAN